MSLSVFDDIGYQHKVFNLILFYASEEGNKPIINKEELILFEMAAALTEYCNGKVDDIPPPGNIAFDDYWWRRLNRIIKAELELNSKHINLVLIQALERLLMVRWDSDHGESWWETDIRWQLMAMQRDMGRVLHLTVPQAQEARGNMQEMDADTAEHCKQIGILMRKYIERDLMVFD